MNRFWSWFHSYHIVLSNAYYSEHWLGLHAELRAAIDRYLPTEVPINWEIGPGPPDMLQFALCPTVASNLNVASTAMEEAPDISGWTFRLGRAPKPFDAAVHFDFRSKDGMWHHIDCSDWYFILLPYDTPGQFALVLLATSFDESFSDDDYEELAVLIAHNVLGELIVLTKIPLIRSGQFGDLKAERRSLCRPISVLSDTVLHS